MITDHHAKYYAHELTRRAAGDDVDRISTSLFDASVDLNPHQIEAALFALRSPLSKGVILADEVGLGKTIEAGLVLCQYWAERKRRLLVICPLFSDYWKEVMVSTAVYALLAVSWELLYMGGLISLGQSLFYGVGAYIAGAVNAYWGVPPIFSIPIATIAGGLLCTIMLLPVLRLRGIYFAMVTLVLPLLLSRFVEATRILGGTEGLTGIDSFDSQWVAFYLVQVALLVAFFGGEADAESEEADGFAVSAGPGVGE